MMTTRTMDSAEPNDSDLVAKSLGGSREAFRQIVERYQTLICSVAYSATGNVSQSQDMAQETFLAAWKDLPSLREPAKLRAWLCRIVRNRVSKSYRREVSDPVTNAAPLEEVHDVPTIGAQPSEEAVTREEEAILWRSLEKIPETYREPLILFYREHQSIESVAAALELSEDAVKQRLSRGRKLLQEEVQAFVEKTLVRTAPGSQFSGAVLAALPLKTGPVTAATASLGAKGAATAKTGFLTLGMASLAPFFGTFAGMFTQWMLIRSTTSGRERRGKTIELIFFWLFIPGTAVAGECLVYSLRSHLGWDDRTFFIARTVFWWLFTLLLSFWLVMGYRQTVAKQLLMPAEIPAVPARPTSLFKTALVSAGFHLMMFWWLLRVTWRSGDHVTAGLIASLVIVLGIVHLFVTRGMSGLQVIRANFGFCAFYFALIIVVINLRLEVWLATGRGVGLAEIHQLYPLWLVPWLSVAVAGWVALLLIVTGRQQRFIASQTAGKKSLP